MIYLDTSVLLKLYVEEAGSRAVTELVASQSHPLPIWSLIEVEVSNAFWFKVFTGQMKDREAEALLARFSAHAAGGLFYTPSLDLVSVQHLSLRLTRHTARLGCRTLDILHVAAARLCGARTFVTADRRQAALAEAEGFTVRIVA